MALPPHLADLEGRLASRVDEALAGFRRAFETRLREATERLLAEATDVASPNVAGLLAEVESEALDAAPRREGARAALSALLDAARRFDRADGQSEVLEIVVDAARPAADRIHLLLVRDDTLVEFASAGFDPAPERGREHPFAGDLRERLDATRGCLVLDADAAATTARELGWTPHGPALVVPLVLRDRIAALLWADRAATAPELPTLQLLTLLAAQRLELQPLSNRAATPTLFDAAEAAVAPLPLWSALPAPEERLETPSGPPAETATAAFVEPQLDAEEAFEIVGDEASALPAPAESDAESALDLAPESAPAPAWAPAEAAPEPALPVDSHAETVVDELWTGPVTAPLDLSAFAPAAEPEPESVAAEAPAPAAEIAPEPSGPSWDLSSIEPEAPSALTTFEMEAISLEPAADAPIEPEPEPAFEPVEPLPEPPAEAPAPETEIDMLRTMRLPILNFPLAGAERRPEEATAPLQIEEVSPARQGASTHEFPVPSSLDVGSGVAAPDADLSEDATLLTRRFPVMPAAPAAAEEPAPAPPPVAPFAPLATTPFGSPVASGAAPGATPAPAPLPPPAAPAAPVQPVEDPMDRTSSRQRSTEVAPPPDLQGPGRAFLGGRVQRAAAESPTHEEAKRLARLLISEIKLYNEEQVLEGRRNRDLYHRLKEDIDRSRQIYEERVDAAVRSGSDYFHQELVRSLAGGDPRALGI